MPHLRRPLFRSPDSMTATKDDTIGLQQLLDEISKDLDELVQKNPKDYSNRGTVPWWMLERERVLARHLPATIVKKLRKAASVKKWLWIFSAGWLVMVL